jgi:hypothetical protein
MKSYAIAAALLFASTSVLANDFKFVNADGNELSGLCIAAVESNEPVNAVAEGLGLASVSASEVACNGRPIVDFVRKYRTDFSAAPRTVYIMNSGNEAPETQLCLAALASEELYNQIKVAHFADVKNVESTVNCNGMPLSKFVRKYRNRLASTPAVNTAAL